MKRTKRTLRDKLKDKLDDAWRFYIYERDKICQKCEKPLEKGHRNAHHIVTKGAAGLAGRWDIDNGMGLCIHCHKHDSGKYYVEFSRFVEGWCRKKGFEYDDLKVKYKGAVYKPANEDLEIKLKVLEELLKEVR